MHTFFDRSVKTDYIKNLLKNTYIPLIDFVTDNDYIIRGKNYIYNHDIIKCTKTGQVKNGAKYTSLSNNYIFGRYYPSFTENYIAINDYYDSALHEALGRYLRAYSTSTGINLMPYYNCFSDRFVQDIYYNSEQKKFLVNNQGLKVAVFPIKMNKTYSIYIDSIKPILIYPRFITQQGELVDINGDLFAENFLLENPDKVLHTATDFKTPVFYNFKYTKEDVLRYENLLYLAIQISDTNNSSIVVIENDDGNTRDYVINAEKINTFTKDEMNTFYNVKNKSLSILNFDTQFAFSNRLYEYLINNVVIPNDEITSNINRVQTRLPLVGIRQNYYYNEYNNYVRYKAYTYTQQLGTVTNIDQDGFINKDVEGGIG